MPNREKIVEKQIDEMVGALTDPIIVMPGGWGDTLPEWVKARITVERLAENMGELRGEQPTGTDAEAVAYLYTAALTAPMGTEWSNIYFYVMTKVMGEKLPEDLRKEELPDHEWGLLQEFKRWLWKARVNVRQERARAKRREEKEEAAARAPKQMGLPI